MVSNLATYGTLALELGLAVLIWIRRARPWVLLAGVAFHLLIEITMRVGFFASPCSCTTWPGLNRSG